jgi:hypothetical protein
VDTTNKITERSDGDLDRIIRELNTRWTGKLPVEAIRAAQEHREEMIPRLIQTITDATEQAKSGPTPKGNAHFFALFLLTEFKAIESLPAILDAISLPGEGPFDLFGDAVTENLWRVLAVFATEPFDTLDALISDVSLNEYVRWQAAHAYLCLVRDGLLTRDEAVDRLRNHLRDAIRNGDAVLAEGMVSDLYSYSPHEAEAEIREAFQLGLVDTRMIDIKDVERSLIEGESHFQSALDHCREAGIADTVEELKSWSCFQEEPESQPHIPINTWQNGSDWDFDLSSREPSMTIRNTQQRVGRNDPCPCGSGKKHKKCCGAK